MTYALIDCSHVCYSAYYAMPRLSNGNVETPVLYGFLQRMLSVTKHLDTNRLIFCWDSPRSIRKERYSWYKERRSKNRDQAMMEIINEQKEVLRNVILPRMGFKNQLMVDGYEADDIMAYLVANYPKKKFVIVANDEDLYQILRYKNLKGILQMKDWKLFTKEDFKAEYLNMPPSRWHRVKAIAGCGTDEVPGVVGVGDMTAVKYLTGNLPDRYKAYGDIVSEGGRAIAKRNLWLVTLPLEGIQPEEVRILKNKFSHKGFESVCRMYKFMSLYNNRFTWYRMMRG